MASRRQALLAARIVRAIADSVSLVLADRRILADGVAPSINFRLNPTRATQAHGLPNVVQRILGDGSSSLGSGFEHSQYSTRVSF